MTLLAKLAQLEWDQRLAHAKRAVAARHWSQLEAEARLLPWLAIALRAGAEPAEAAAELEAARKDPAFASYPRTHVALACCPTEDMRAELARARDAALTAAFKKPDDRAACERSTRLQYLALFLGAPAARPIEAQSAAA